MPENDEKKEVKIPIKEGDLQDSTISQLIKEKIEKDSKETVVGRKGHVDEGQAEPKEFTNNELMTKLEEIVEGKILTDQRLIDRFNKLEERIEWLEKMTREKSEYLRFSQRLEISDAAANWCHKNGVSIGAFNIVVALNELGIMDIKKAVAWCQDKKKDK